MFDSSGRSGSSAGDPLVGHQVDLERGLGAGGQADVDDFDAAGVLGAGQRVQADFGVAERDGEVGGNGARVDGAGVGVDAGRQVDGDEPRRLRPGAELTDALQYLRQVRFDGARWPGAEEGVDDQLGVGEEAVEGGEAGVVFGVGDVDFALDELGEVGVVGAAFCQQVDARFGAPVVQVAGRDEAVAAVVAGTGQDDDATPLDDAQQAADFLRDAQAGVLHELGDGNARLRRLLVEGARSDRRLRASWRAPSLSACRQARLHV